MRLEDELGLIDLEEFLKLNGYVQMSIDNIIRGIEFDLEEGKSFNGLLNNMQRLKSRGQYVYPELSKFKRK